MRTAADKTGKSLKSVSVLAPFRTALSELAHRGTRVRSPELTQAVAMAPGVVSSGVTIRDGRVICDVMYEDGQVGVELMPLPPQFAPRGAKEVRFQVSPSGAASDPRVREIVAAVAGAMARTLWSIALRQWDETTDHQAMADSDGDIVRVDLRTVPAVRNATHHRTWGLLLQAIDLESVTIEDDRLQMTLKPPMMPM